MSPRKKQEAAPAASLTVRCAIDNVWTSEGKLRRGEEATLPAEEAVALADQEKVHVVS